MPRPSRRARRAPSPPRARRDRRRREQPESRARPAPPRRRATFASTVQTGALPKWKRTTAQSRSRRRPRSRADRGRPAGPDSPRARARRGTPTKIPATAANDSWNPARAATPASSEQDERAEREEVPAVARPRDEPGERGEHAGDSRADDRRLPADREHVRDDRGDRQHLAHVPRQPEQPAEPADPDHDEGDVLPGHGQQVSEPGGPEVCPRTRSGRPSSSPRTTPSTSARRTPPVPRPTALLDVSRSASPSARDPPRRPTWRQSPPRRTTGSPGGRARHARRSRRPRAARGSATRTTVSRIGAARRRAADGKHEQHALADGPTAESAISAGTRTAHDVTRAGPVDDEPRGARTRRPRLRARSRRARPGAALPTTARRPPAPLRVRRRDPGRRARDADDREERDRAERDQPGRDPVRDARARRTRQPTSSAGQWSSTTRLTGSPGRAAARSASARCPGPRPGPRPT